MKINLFKFLSLGCLLAFGSALVTPAEAARTKPAVLIIINTTPKPVVSGS